MTQSLALAMREACAKLIRDNRLEWNNSSWRWELAPRNPGNNHCLEYADAIDALPIPDEPAPGADEDRFTDAYGSVCRDPTKCDQCGGSGIEYSETCLRCGGLGSYCEAESARPAPASEVDVVGLRNKIIEVIAGNDCRYMDMAHQVCDQIVDIAIAEMQRVRG